MSCTQWRTKQWDHTTPDRGESLSPMGTRYCHKDRTVHHEKEGPGRLSPLEWSGIPSGPPFAGWDHNFHDRPAYPLSYKTHIVR